MNWQAKSRMTQIFFKKFLKTELLLTNHLILYFSRHPLVLLCWAHTSSILFILHRSTTKCWPFPWSASILWPVLVATKSFHNTPFNLEPLRFLKGEGLFLYHFSKRRQARRAYCSSIFLSSSHPRTFHYQCLTLEFFVILGVLVGFFGFCLFGFGFCCLSGFLFDSLKAP